MIAGIPWIKLRSIGLLAGFLALSLGCGGSDGTSMQHQADAASADSGCQLDASSGSDGEAAVDPPMGDSGGAVDGAGSADASVDAGFDSGVGADAGPEHCRENPDTCVVGVGAICSMDDDCPYPGGSCCTADSNCRGGMCTYRCREDSDCPVDMACEHRVCFFRCSRDADCATGMECEHRDTVCEWP